MNWFIETTKGLPKHSYLLDKGKTQLFAYIKANTKEVIEIKNEKGYLRFDSRQRTFKEI